MEMDEDSFIILGTSPGSSLIFSSDPEVKSDIIANTDEIDDAIKDLSFEASMALKASLHLNDCPSPAGMMAASMIVTEDKSTEDLQKHFGEIFDENVVLKEVLRSNNQSMKEKFELIASYQKDMMEMHEKTQDKFQKTKELIERLHRENRQLKSEISSLSDSSRSPSVSVQTEPISDIEFVSSQDEDCLNRLKSQLTLLESQRKQVIAENEILSWQKVSLEHMLNITNKERDALKKKLADAELLCTALRDCATTLRIREPVKEEEKNILSSEDRVENLKLQAEQSDILKAHLEVYKNDFESERKLRLNVAAERDSVIEDLRVLQQRNQDLVVELESLRKSKPAKEEPPRRQAADSSNGGASASTTGNTIYRCPKCLRFSSESYNTMEDHFDFCLDDF